MSKIAYLTGQDGRRYRVIGNTISWSVNSRKLHEGNDANTFNFHKELGGVPGRRVIFLTEEQQRELNKKYTTKLLKSISTSMIVTLGAGQRSLRIIFSNK